jgi:tetratricopeptide (TPR) repeat protein
MSDSSNLPKAMQEYYRAQQRERDKDQEQFQEKRLKEKWQDAYVIFRQIHDLEPKNVDVLRQMGAMLANQGLYDDAIKWYNKALELDPKNVDVIFEKETCQKMKQED